MNYKQSLSELLAKCTSLPQEELLTAIETPADAKLGHMAFPCFRLSKELKKAPPVIAAELAAQISESRPPWLGEVKATGPYVNFFFDRAIFAGNVLGEILTKGQNYGASGIGAGKNVVMDYSSPNIAKPMHVGHLGSTIIGASLDRIYRFLGYNVTAINHLGDWGTQFGKMIVAYLKWGNKEEIEKTGIDGLVALYVRFHEEADTDPSLNDEARAWVVKLQNGDKEGMALWQWFIDISLIEYERQYKRMGVRFNLYRGESYYNDKMDVAVELLRKKGLLKESDGAQIVDLEEYNMPPCLILRSDGGTLYATRDISTAMDRQENFKFDKCLYVTGQEQILHFAQFFKVLELMGYPWAKGLVHIPYGMFRFEHGKLSTRRGDVIKMDDLMDEAIAKTKAIIEEKNPDLPNKDTIAEQVGIGAMIFNKLYTNRIKDTVFSWDLMLNFDGETGPYVQYAHARACSVLEKAGYAQKAETGFARCSSGVWGNVPLLIEDEAFEVLRIIYDFPAKIEEAAEKYEPFMIARQLVALAQAFNSFYHHHVVLVDDQDLRQARLALVAAVQTQLEIGLKLLGMSAPRAM